MFFWALKGCRQITQFSLLANYYGLLSLSPATYMFGTELIHGGTLLDFYGLVAETALLENAHGDLISIQIRHVFL